MAWRGYDSFGKSALGVSIKLSGLDEYLKKIELAGNAIEPACKEAVEQSAAKVKDYMVKGARRHQRTGEVVRNIEATSAKESGNYIYSDVGIDLDAHPEAFEGVFQEYGDGHSPCFPDPFVAPAFDEHKTEIKSIQRKILKKAGIPID